MFLRCSGVDSTEDGGDEGASVGEDVSDPDGMFSGSNSRSGSEGSSSGRRVIRSRTSRSSALENGPVMPYFRELGHVLYGLENDYPPPTGVSRHLATQAYLDKQLREADELERTGSPFVPRVLIAPRSSVSRMRRGGDQWLVLGIRLRDFREERIMVHAHDIEKCGDYVQLGSTRRECGRSNGLLTSFRREFSILEPSRENPRN